MAGACPPRSLKCLQHAALFPCLLTYNVPPVPVTLAVLRIPAAFFQWPVPWTLRESWMAAVFYPPTISKRHPGAV